MPERGTARHFLSLALVASLLVVAACSDGGAPAPQVRNGEIDLRAWNFQIRGEVDLRGEWHFFPGQLLTGASEASHPELARVPDNWHLDFGEGFPGGFGFGTYQLTLRLPADREGLGLRLKTVSTAYTIYAGQELVTSVGTVGVSALESEAAYQPQVVELDDLPPVLVLSVQVSNFEHARGGFWESAQLGLLSDLERKRQASLHLTLFLASAALVIGLYHFLTWLLRPHDYSLLIFAFLCLALVARDGSINELYLLEWLSDLNFRNLVRIEYLSLDLLVALCLLFVWRIARADVSTRAMLALLCPVILYGVVVVLAPVVVFTAYLWVLQGLVVLSLLWATRVIIRALQRKQRGTRLYALSFVLLVTITIHDILLAVFPEFPTLAFLPGDNHLVPVGFLAVLLTQALVLARRSTAAMRELQLRTRELSEAKQRLDSYAVELESRVEKRTEDLVKANVQLERLSRIDGLTNLYNRREFDTQLYLAWSDHMRRQSVLSVLMVDIDKFKDFNDTYGHMQGDEALVAVSSALHSAVSRPSDLVARYGGEEMVVLLPNTDADGARGIAERMREAVQGLNIPHEKSGIGVVTVSVGGASRIPPRGGDASTLLEAADKALYRAKESGRNRVVVDGSVPVEREDQWGTP